MKVLIKTRQQLEQAARWDIDFHLPPELIHEFPATLHKRVDSVARVAKDKRDPSSEAHADHAFQYLDISSVDVAVGLVETPQELDGSEAPSRARKVVRAYDVLVSTCRPTRGAIAVVPPQFHNQIASTGFTVLRPLAGVNPFYLQYALRLPSTLEQFRKWSTGSSYPAILDEDVEKTLIPVPDQTSQDQIAELMVNALRHRAQALLSANEDWNRALQAITSDLMGIEATLQHSALRDDFGARTDTAEIESYIATLEELTTDQRRPLRALRPQSPSTQKPLAPPARRRGRPRRITPATLEGTSPVEHGVISSDE